MSGLEKTVGVMMTLDLDSQDVKTHLDPIIATQEAAILCPPSEIFDFVQILVVTKAKR